MLVLVHPCAIFVLPVILLPLAAIARDHVRESLHTRHARMHCICQRRRSCLYWGFGFFFLPLRAFFLFYHACFLTGCAWRVFFFAQIRAEVDALKISDASLIARLTALEQRGAAGLNAAAASAGANAGANASTTSANAGAAATAAAEAGALATAQAKALFDEAEERARKAREDVHCPCVQCGTEYFPSQSGPSDCKYHPYSVTPHNYEYIYPCCRKTCRSYNDASYVEGCTHGAHAAEHHLKLPYARHQVWIGDVLSDKSVEHLHRTTLPDFADGYVKFAHVVSALMGGKHTLFVTLGRGRMWGARMAALTGDKLATMLDSSEAHEPVPLVRYSRADLSDNDAHAVAAGEQDTWFVEAFLCGTTASTGFVELRFRVGSSPDVVFSERVHFALEPLRGAQAGSFHVAFVRHEPVVWPEDRAMTAMTLMKLRAAMSNQAPFIDAAGMMPQYTGMPLIAEGTLPVPVRHKCEGDSVLRIKTDGDVDAGQSFGSGSSFHNFFMVPAKVMNPGEKKLTLVELTGEYQVADGSWVRAAHPVRLGQTGRRGDYSWSDSTTLIVEPQEAVNVAFRLDVEIQGKSGADNFARRRAHRSLPQPFVFRVIAEDIMGNTVSIVFEQVNEPLGLTTPESWAKNNNSGVLPHGFLACDNHETQTRKCIALYRRSRADHISVLNSSITLNPINLAEWAYKARMNRVNEIDVFTHTDGEFSAAVRGIVHPSLPLLGAVRLTLRSASMSSEAVFMLPPVPQVADSLVVSPAVMGLGGGQLTLQVSLAELNTDDILAVARASASAKASFEHDFGSVTSAEVTAHSATGTCSRSMSIPTEPGSYVVRLFPAGAERELFSVESNVFVVQA